MKAVKENDLSILITDDDTGSRESLRDIFEPRGFRILLACSGEEAVDIVRAGLVHLLLLDMHMPSMTGLETLQLVRQFQADLPCILVTGDASSRLMQQAIQAHVFTVIPKPINKNVVLWTAFRALSRYYGLPQSRHG